MLRALLAGAAVLGVLLGLQTWRAERLKTELIELRVEAQALRDFKAGAITDASEQARQCQARVDDARRSAQRIETIIERPIHVDPQGCAIRRIVPADELRNALQPDLSAEPVR